MKYLMVMLDEIDDSLDRVSKLLAGIPDGVYRAVGSALKRSAQHGLTVGTRIVTEKYAISQGELKARTRNINTIVKDTAGSYEVTFGYRGNVIPLIKFDTKFGADGRVHTRVLRSNAQQVLDNAFVAHVGGHTGVFEREGPERFPIRELFGPSVPQAFNEEDETTDRMTEEILKTYESRIEHEIMRVLNGWGG